MGPKPSLKKQEILTGNTCVYVQPPDTIDKIDFRRQLI